ncbi:MAG: hypothetical protein KME07_25250 [Pegethrix bostrychoides GSE-TBD4-15B]|jgi:hypothetical protein|uniref:Uncharacterized protein n=1 Tax=Pegethrix bostrychoides GSE-TBD4-15B TaxID=2839662 RepID=A0A951PG05_9CYAN|nr:hypothetical protein [Pegethrix bostrychoides GSE-TBD4-15B]
MTRSKSSASARSTRRIALSESPRHLSGQLGKRQELFYQFKLSRSSTVYLSLSEFVGNADLALLNRRQKVLSQSQQAGQASEFMSSRLKKGLYLIRVQNKTRSKTRFQLKFGTTDLSPTVISNGLSVGSEGTMPLTTNHLQAIDALQASDRLRYSITGTPRNGILLLNGIALTVGSSFTQADIDAGRLVYRSGSSIRSLGSASSSLLDGPLVSGWSVLWVGTGGSDGGSDTEVFFYDGSSTRQLTQNNVNERAEGIDGNHLVWSSQVGAALQGVATYELFDYDGGSIRQLTSNAVNENFVGLAGDNLFWTSPVGAADAVGRVTSEVFYAKSGAVRQLTQNNVNEDVSDFEGATAVWEAKLGPTDANGRATGEIFYFDGSNVRQITQNAVSDSAPRISGGRIAWSSQIGTPNLGAATNEIMLYDGGKTTQLTFNDIDDFMGDISGSTVAWIGRSGPLNGLGQRSYEIYRSDSSVGGSTQRLTNNGFDDYVVELSGSNLLWRGSAGAPDSYGQRSYELFLNDGSKTTQLTQNQVDDRPIGLQGSKAVWFSQTGSPNAEGVATREIFYYDGGKVRQLTADAKNDDFPSFSAQTLAWRSTEGTASQILSYELDDQFGYTVSDGSNRVSTPQLFKIQYI